MARISGVNIPNDKRILIALTYIYGIARPTAAKILTKLKIDENIRVKDLKEADLTKIRNEISANYTIEGEVRRETMTNIKRLMEIASYRGIRHRRGLPVRGQRSKQNARTRKGPKKTQPNKKK